MADTGLCFILPNEDLPEGGAAAVGNKAWNLMRLAQAGLPEQAASARRGSSPTLSTGSIPMTSPARTCEPSSTDRMASGEIA